MTKSQLREDIETLTLTGVALLAGFFMTKKMKEAAPKQAARTRLTATYHDFIPGWADMRQRCPVRVNTDGVAAPLGVECKFNLQELWRRRDPFLQNTIIHLNDEHRWTREEIADWLETLDHDLTFKTPEEVKL